MSRLLIVGSCLLSASLALGMGPVRMPLNLTKTPIQPIYQQAKEDAVKARVTRQKVGTPLALTRAILAEQAAAQEEWNLMNSQRPTVDFPPAAGNQPIASTCLVSTIFEDKSQGFCNLSIYDSNCSSCQGNLDCLQKCPTYLYTYYYDRGIVFDDQSNFSLCKKGIGGAYPSYYTDVVCSGPDAIPHNIVPVTSTAKSAIENSSSFARYNPWAITSPESKHLFNYVTRTALVNDDTFCTQQSNTWNLLQNSFFNQTDSSETKTNESTVLRDTIANAFIKALPQIFMAERPINALDSIHKLQIALQNKNKRDASLLVDQLAETPLGQDLLKVYGPVKTTSLLEYAALDIMELRAMKDLSNANNTRKLLNENQLQLSIGMVAAMNPKDAANLLNIRSNYYCDGSLPKVDALKLPKDEVLHDLSLQDPYSGQFGYQSKGAVGLKE